jgi:hypothetical protein
MKHVMKHDLSQDKAREVAEQAFASYRARYAQYNPTLTWLDDKTARASFAAKGISINGTIELLPGAIAFDLDVPFVLRIFERRAIAIMERELRHWTDEARAKQR